MLNASKFINLYNEYLESGLTVRGYCANQHMKESLFFYWQNKLKSQLPPKRGFIPVVFGNQQQGRTPKVSTQVQNQSKTLLNPAVTNQTFSCEIVYPNGVCLKLNSPMDSEMLRSLLLLTQQ